MLKYLKHIIYLLILISVVLVIYSLISHDSVKNEIWFSLLLNAFFFLSLSAFGYLFISFHLLAKSNWHLPFIPSLSSMGRFFPYSTILFLILLVGVEKIYPWTVDTSLSEGRSWYLNTTFFIFRTLFIIAIWNILWYKLKKSIFGKKRKLLYASLFTISFSVFFLIIAHDWLMTLCCTMNSTLFSWFILVGLLSIGMAGTILMFFIKTGYRSMRRKQTLLTDGARYLFTFSCVWMYFWYSQFMLIWYGNIEHETYYFANQYFNFKPLFILMLVLNFGIPLFLLISKSQKKKPFNVFISSISILMGQWINLYLSIFPVITNNYAFIYPIAVLFFMAALFLIITLKIRIKKFRLIYPIIILGAILTTSCSNRKSHPGYSYYPEMTYSRPYQTYSSNPFFPDSVSMRNPVEGTVPQEMLPFQYAKTPEDRIRAGIEKQNPLEANQQNIQEGKFLYDSFCLQCHGESGNGMGKLYTDKLYTYKPGVLTSEKIRIATDGDVFHAISSGFNLMGPHKSILLPDERWKLVIYIRTLPDLISQ